MTQRTIKNSTQAASQNSGMGAKAAKGGIRDSRVHFLERLCRFRHAVPLGLLIDGDAPLHEE